MSATHFSQSWVKREHKLDVIITQRLFNEESRRKMMWNFLQWMRCLQQPYSEDDKRLNTDCLYKCKEFIYKLKYYEYAI